MVSGTESWGSHPETQEGRTESEPEMAPGFESPPLVTYFLKEGHMTQTSHKQHCQLGTKYSNTRDLKAGASINQTTTVLLSLHWAEGRKQKGEEGEGPVLQLVPACGPSWTPFWPLLRRMAREGSRTLEKGIPGDRVSQEPSAQSVLSNSKKGSLRLNACRYKPNSTSATRKWIGHISKQMKLWL